MEELLREFSPCLDPNFEKKGGEAEERGAIGGNGINILRGSTEQVR